MASNRMLLLALCAAVLVGCGGEPDPAEQVKETVTDSAEDARAGRWGDYCAATTDPDACSEEIMTALALRIDLASLIPTSDVLDGMKVSVKGERATVDSTAAEDATYVLRDGRWLYLWESE